MAEVSWADQALQNLEDIRLYIGIDNPFAAGRVAAALIVAAESLCALPDRGRAIGGGARELTHMRPYIIRYRHDPEHGVVEILAVWHGARSRLP